MILLQNLSFTAQISMIRLPHFTFEFDASACFDA